MLCSPGQRSQSLAAAFGKSRRLKSEGACDPRSNSITIRKQARRPPARAQLSPRSQNFKLPIQNCTYEIRTPFINPERRQHLQHCARSGRLRLKRKTNYTHAAFPELNTQALKALGRQPQRKQTHYRCVDWQNTRNQIRNADGGPQDA